MRRLKPVFDFLSGGGGERRRKTHNLLWGSLHSQVKPPPSWKGAGMGVGEEMYNLLKGQASLDALSRIVCL